MSLKDRLQSDLTNAIKSRDEIHMATIRMMLSAITNEEVSGKAVRVLMDAEIITVLTREAKKRKEAAEAFALGGRMDRAERETAEGLIIAEYLPEQMGADELAKLVAEAIAESGASGPAAMGAVMKVLTPKIAGRAAGGDVAAAVRAALAQV
ncbi:MAG TPA: GatB/YqeY domain-containing protein [Candidatus Nanopelagicaceae bacterium]|nr:GatB/YqeY domain-containing protein [Candidatus Nanopelagicaceae bacterium]